MKPGSLFPALHRMEQAGYLKSFWGESENNRRAKFYALTAAGRTRARPIFDIGCRDLAAKAAISTVN